MANQPIPTLPVAIALDGSEQLEIVQPAGSGGTTKRATAEQIANTATAFVSGSTVIETLGTSGLAGGGNLSQSRSLSVSPNNLNEKTNPVPSDLTILGDSANSFAPVKTTISNFYKSVAGLPSINVPNLAEDFLLLYHADDDTTRKVTPSSLGLSAGNLPAGGTTGQYLIKASDTNYDVQWSTTFFTVEDGGTGLTTVAQGDLIYGSALNTYSRLTKNTTATRYLSNTGTNNNPAWAQINLANGVTSTLPVANGGTGSTSLTQYRVLVGNGTSAVATVAPSATSGVSLVSQGSSANPTFGTVVAAGGGTGQTSYAVGDILYADTTTSLAKLADVATGNALISGGVSTAPAWGKIGLTTHVSGTLPATNGGTGQTSYTTGDILYANSSSTLAALPDVATGNALISGGVGTAPAWGKVGLTTHVTGTLTVANGGTGATTLTNKGILIGNAAGAITATAAMTNGQILVGSTGLAPVPRTMSGDATLNSSGALTIANAAVSLAKMANLAANSILGNNTGSAATPIALTPAQVLTLIGAMSASGGQTVTGGFAMPSQSLGTYSAGGTIPVNFLTGAHQHVTVSTTSTVTFGDCAIDGECIIAVTNGVAGVSLSFVNLGKQLAGSANVNTASGAVNWIYIYRINGVKAYSIQNISP
jgi:hypothetical protein